MLATNYKLYHVRLHSPTLDIIPEPEEKLQHDVSDKVLPKPTVTSMNFLHKSTWMYRVAQKRSHYQVS